MADASCRACGQEYATIGDALEYVETERLPASFYVVLDLVNSHLTAPGQMTYRESGAAVSARNCEDFSQITAFAGSYEI